MLLSYQKPLPVNCELIPFLQIVSGFDPVQVHLVNRIDSSPVQDDVVDKHSNSLMVELSPPPPGDSTFTVDSPPGQVAEVEQSEFPEGMQRETRPLFYLLILSLGICIKALY